MDPVLVGIGGTLLGVVVTRVFDLVRWHREDRRWQAEPYRQHRADALIELHRTLTECLPSYLLGDAPQPFEAGAWRKHFNSRLIQAHRASVVVKPYLEKDQGIAVAEALLIFRQVEKGFLDFAVAEGAHALDKASDIFKRVAEPYVDRYSRIVEFLEPMLVPQVVKERARKAVR